MQLIILALNKTHKLKASSKWYMQIIHYMMALCEEKTNIYVIFQ